MDTTLNIRAILLPTDFSPCSARAIPLAISLAKRFGSSLHLFHAIENGGIPAVDELRLVSLDQEGTRRMEEVSAVNLAEILSAYDFTGIRVERSQVRCHSTAAEILRIARIGDFDMIVMGTHGWSGVKKLLLGSVTERVVRLATCPVVSVGKSEKALGEVSVSRILVPIDFSEHSLEALGNAKQLAALFDARLQLLHIIQEPVMPEFYVRDPGRLLGLNRLVDRAKVELHRCVGEFGGPSVPFDAHVIKGKAATKIIRFAEDEKSDLIVMATHGLTGMRYFLMGAVTQKVIQRSPCPVMTFKSEALRPIEVGLGP